eukprot:CAMPEP_0201501350 /NCGR_PEP_ID=MMETSP0151_2-20130828/83544_1 /ASSEMBLY_ACC=CAM_ASM_000257 /TAXON_ID=200890 /ORGANISM="Paramoeba atlantica, Strain 621/1 / CCAP 1560/9" /LENGTH=282 /DNA_ID=CAMNT_0047894853 /DNA_START=50 /DNA_END=898 /DNA_ORIENTATION=-
MMDEKIKVASSPYFLNNYIEILSSILRRIVKYNDASPGCDKVVTQFHSETAPSVAIRDYMERILKLTKCEPGSIVLAVAYMLRICRDHNIPLTSLCFHRLFITSVCVSMKYFEDDVYSNKYMAKVGGISTRELSVLERLHLVMLKFSLMISPIDYGNFCKEAVQLEGQILLDSVPTKGKKRQSPSLSALNLIHRLLPQPPEQANSEKGSSSDQSSKEKKNSKEQPKEDSKEQPKEDSKEQPKEQEKEELKEQGKEESKEKGEPNEKEEHPKEQEPKDEPSQK